MDVLYLVMKKKSSSYTYLINRTIKYTFICRLDLFVILVYVFEAKKYDNSYLDISKKFEKVIKSTRNVPKPVGIRNNLFWVRISILVWEGNP